MYRSVAQPGSASGLGPEGREFESLHSDHPSLIIGNLARPKLCGWWREKPVAIRRCHSIKRGIPTVHDLGVGFMARARIYKPCKTSMQSGRKAQVTRGNAWVLEYPRSAVVRPDPLMGWQSSADTARQVRVRFPDKDSAIAYAEARGIDYQVTEPKHRRVKPKAYADNFAFTRNGAWTH